MILIFSISYNIPQWFAFEADFENYIVIDKRNSTFFLVRFLQKKFRHISIIKCFISYSFRLILSHPLSYTT